MLPDPNDRIEYYDLETLYKWLFEILDSQDARLSLPHIPFNYNELTREIIRRDNLNDMFRDDLEQEF